MTIPSTLETLGSISSAQRIGTVLRTVDAQLTALGSGQRDQLTDRSLSDIVEGLEVTPGVFPAVVIAAGSLLTPAGALYEYSGGSFSLTPAADAIAYFYISVDYTIETAASVPETARMALGRVTFNHAATDFFQVKPYGLETVDVSDSNNLLEESGIYRGPTCLELASYAFDADGFPESFLEHTAYRARFSTYAYNTDGELESKAISQLAAQAFYLDGAVPLDDNLYLDDEEFAGQVSLPQRRLTANGTRFADGGEAANGEL